MHVGYPNVTEDYKKNIKRELNVQNNKTKKTLLLHFYGVEVNN